MTRAASLALVGLCLAPGLAAQLVPPTAGGATALAHELRSLGVYKRVLVVAAHPDDEDTELITIVSRGMGGEAAYLSLNRGEGGQNLIGPELGEELGVIRTEELLAARQLDGGRQYFTRAFDFGFSKSIDETLRFWPRDTLLKDVVRVIRRFRPQVVVTVFSGTPRDGHGQHQAAGVVAPEAFAAAGDPTRFPELAAEEYLAPWAPLKLYRSTRFDTTATTLVLDGGVLDGAVGRSYHQIAMESRSLHRSQDMGQLQGIGPSRVRLQLLVDRTGADSGDAGLFAGIDTSLAALINAGRPPGAAPAEDLPAVAELDRLLSLVRSRAWMPPNDTLAALLDRARALLPAYTPPSVEVADLRGHLDRAWANAMGLVTDVVADRSEVAPGDSFRVTVTAWNAGSVALTRARLALSLPGGWRINGMDSPGPGIRFLGDELALPAGQVAMRSAWVSVPDSATPTTPYFLAHPRNGAMYDWSHTPPDIRGLPFTPAALWLWGGLMDSSGALVSRDVTYRGNDQASGEFRLPVEVVPRLTVSLSPRREFWPAGSSAPRTFEVTLASGTRDSLAGEVSIATPAGWPAVSAQRFRLPPAGHAEGPVFRVRPPATAREGVYLITAHAGAAGGTDSMARTVISYPHIRPHGIVSVAQSRVTIARLSLPPLTRVGYIRGAADRVPEALADAGVPIELLDGRALRSADLGRFNAIVVGPRAYETDSVLVAANDRLLDYAGRGGLVIVQYQQYGFFTGGYAPYPLTVASRAPGADPRAATATMRQGPGPAGAVSTALLGGHDRVTDETAPVTAVQPIDPVLLSPNRIGASDWDGWVQERGLYFARSWDEHYRSVIETHDPGEPPLEGGLLVAKTGRGTYVYTGLSFFRQLPAGVPGAYRLFANLLGLNGGQGRTGGNEGPRTP